MCGIYQKIGEAIVKPYAEGANLAKKAYSAQQNSPTTSVSQNSGNSQMPSSSGNSQMPSSNGQQQQQQVQPTSMPRATTGRFSFNNGNFRIGESNMNASDTGLNI